MCVCVCEESELQGVDQGFRPTEAHGQSDPILGRGHSARDKKKICQPFRAKREEEEEKKEKAVGSEDESIVRLRYYDTTTCR